MFVCPAATKAALSKESELPALSRSRMDVMRHIQQEEIAPETIAPHDGLGETEIDTEVND